MQLSPFIRPSQWWWVPRLVHPSSMLWSVWVKVEIAINFVEHLRPPQWMTFSIFLPTLSFCHWNWPQVYLAIFQFWILNYLILGVIEIVSGIFVNPLSGARSSNKFQTLNVITDPILHKIIQVIHSIYLFLYSFLVKRRGTQQNFNK